MFKIIDHASANSNFIDKNPVWSPLVDKLSGSHAGLHGVNALVGFLQRADEEHALHQPRDYGIKLFGAGVVGVVILLGLYSLLWRGRLRGSVNQAIYDRQISST